ncbi:flagellar motor protein PomA [Reinekea thalattae]|uniref:Flagellar motor protein PomA n=1 Tax=Reinekea thalattae TaxID=2593301 RepID=A0A5C8Z999_9GAMM|nr:flagellar motor protein PomA [Reinekea thalattae]TXR54287.1 flagellar motor protein PomA [Reinekea thalattae]
MDLAMIVGIIGATAMVIIAMILGGSITIYINIPSVLIVFGGSAFVALSKFTLEQFLNVGKVVGKAFSFSLVKPEDLIGEIVELADSARKGGLLSLEGKETSADFLSRGIQLLVDGHDPEVVKLLLNKDMRMTSDRHNECTKFFGALADVGPAMGMIGTLIGLVGMLANMDDPKTIGPAMAVALLTTLYGSFLANVVAFPIADKLSVRTKEEEIIQKMCIDGLLAIQAGQNPRVIESLLRSYLPATMRESV